MKANNTKLHKGVHVLFEQANGRPCYAVLVERTEPREEVEARGYLRIYAVNDRRILRGDLRWLGIPEAAEIEAEVARLQA